MLEIGIKDIIDIVIVAALLYYIYRLMKESSSANVLVGIIVFFLIWFVASQIFEMRLMGTILDKMVDLGALALIILFQEEIRHFFSSIGTKRRAGAVLRLFTGRKKTAVQREDVMPIVMACINMAKQKVGALIVIERSVGLNEYIRSGEELNADISQRLLENIFFKNSPLHDGALIISRKRIRAAGCILPVSHDVDIPKSLGLRHRAALGISQKTDCLAFIVSEETGNISMAQGGQLKMHLTPEQLESTLTAEWD